ncbi:MAG: FtsW/RodA/SpoVE family cell cycle protein [Bacteroidales bacterium]|nr:FtsW/RodA/SpoVE family cell cycle protein [Bacteroidales bacterium]MBD5205256.1 FtsW/RodA/SpoVE family cell cycle protein [Bacteroidales bacterium]MBD5224203.1 FtsW/RodA/SpoVE family cell cycle protein [Bacteroidales bacterium]MBD5301959.1 FtsW/RodA/SpoVE family cell cycle protein [Bacteroides sp.]
MDNDLLEDLEIRETLDGVPEEDLNTGRDTRKTGNNMADTAASLGISDRVNASAAARKKTQISENAKVAALHKKKGRPDPYIWGIYIMLLVISIVELFSASSTEVSGANVYGPLIRHGFFLLLGFGIVLWLQKTPYTLFNKFAWLLAIASLGLLLLSSVIGVEYNGAQRAIRFAGITIQPAEIVKLTVVCLLASILGKNQTRGGVTNTGVITAAVVVVIFSACLWKNGLTNTLLLMSVSICMMLIGGIQLKKFLMVMVVYGVAAGALVAVKYMTPNATEYDAIVERQELMSQVGNKGIVSSGSGKSKIDRTGTQKGRLRRHLEGVHPNDPIDDVNRQVMFAKFSQANGGLLGQGPGNSRESARLPLAFSDYIYSIIVEDTGFVGGALVLLLFLLLVARAGRIAYKCSRAFPAFLILGCAVMIVFQALVHMAIVTGLFPVSGQPLPFISKGGTSVLVMSAALGIMLSVARFAAHSGDRQHINAEKNALPEELQAANFSAHK